MQVWASKIFAKKNGLIMEEWLTVTRQKIYLKCKELKIKGLIKEVVTKNGDVFALVLKEDHEQQQQAEDPQQQVDRILVVTDTHFENLLKRTKGVLDDEDEYSEEKEDVSTNEQETPSV